MNSAWMSRAGHAALGIAVAKGSQRFRSACANVEKTQRARLHETLRQVAAVDARIDASWRWEDYSRQMPVTDWSCWHGMVEKQRASTGQRLLIDSPVARYQPTSGSTSAIKWVPYTQQFLAELDAAVAPWLADIYRSFPGVRRGHHYWSLSWLPTSMRAAQRGDLNDDMGLLSSGKRVLANLTQAVPQEVSIAETSDDSLFMTLAYLAADQQLSALSVWSPTFALSMLEKMAEWRIELAAVLLRGAWSAHGYGEASLGAHGVSRRPLRCPQSASAARLLRDWDGELSADFFRQLWPQLALVSAWNTASAAPWATRLQQILPHAGFQGKGLWATEGVITIPQADRHVLACASHVYEFENLDDGSVLAPWELQIGQTVRPLLTTGSGLLRYRMRDLMVVDSFWASAPCLRFLGRDDGTDLVGEKLGAVFVQTVLDDLAGSVQGVPVTVLALDDAGCGKPGYVLLLERGRDTADTHALTVLANRIEKSFCTHFHYQLARNLGQLDAARVFSAPAMRDLYSEHCQSHGMIAGNIKFEPLRHWRSSLNRLFSSAGRHVEHGVLMQATVFSSQAPGVSELVSA